MPHRGLLCCFPSDDKTAERSLLKPSWFANVGGSNPGAQDEEDSVKWQRQGCKTARKAGEWCESLVKHHFSPKWKLFLRRCRAGKLFICKSNHRRFNYDRVSYELNFDQGRSDSTTTKIRGFRRPVMKMECKQHNE